MGPKSFLKFWLEPWRIFWKLTLDLAPLLD